MTKGAVLIVDDKENMRKLLSRILGDKFKVTMAADGAEAIRSLNTGNFDVVVTDIRMPGADGFAVLDAVKQNSERTEVVMVTAFASVESAVDAIKRGAYDYIQKPFDPDTTLRVVERAFERKQLREQAAHFYSEAREKFGFHALIGKSSRMRQLYELISRAAKTDITVLISGESGTGKELTARAIHYESRRSEKKFVAINCGALPGELVESELFGHVKGAFTGAQADKRGLFEETAGGTLFLDEISELPLAAQVKLNRVLQEGEVRRVGAGSATTVDVRIIAACNQDLEAEVEEGRFREDLYYRINVFPILAPSLRERAVDIPLLATHFLDKHVSQHEVSLSGFEPEALQSLIDYRWPGNVRELENAVSRAAVVAETNNIRQRDLPPQLMSRPAALAASTFAHLPYKSAAKRSRDEFTRLYLEDLMREFSGNVTRASERAGLGRESLHRLLKTHDVRAESFRVDDDGDTDGYSK